MRPNEIVVRLEPRVSRRADTGAMGHSIVTTARGSVASVWVQAVRAQATGFGLAFDLLLSYAVAHEIGHCLLGPSHSYAGLMRGRWNRHDASEMSRLSLH